MNQAATEVVRSEAVAAAKAWMPVLAGINDRWQERIPDWRRVFPGLVALLGVQTFLWPEWRRLVQESGRDVADVSPFYAAPPAEAGPVWRFAYAPIHPAVAWAFVGAPGTAPWDQTLATLDTQDVSATLSTLTDAGRVITYGQAPTKLMPLQGTMGKGDQPLALPICDCRAISEMLPEWRLGVENVLPILSRAVRRLFELDPAADADLAFADLFWGVWGELLRSGCITVGVTDERHGLARLLGRPQPHAFVGVLILRGDHYALWEKVGQTA